MRYRTESESTVAEAVWRTVLVESSVIGLVTRDRFVAIYANWWISFDDNSSDLRDGKTFSRHVECFQEKGRSGLRGVPERGIIKIVDPRTPTS